VRAYPGLTLIIWIGLIGAVIALLLVLRIVMQEAPEPITTTAPWIADEQRMQAKEMDRVNVATFVTSMAVLVFGGAVALGGFIARLISRRPYPVDLKPNIMVRWVVPAVLIVLIGFLLLIPVGVSAANGRQRSARAAAHAIDEARRADQQKTREENREREMQQRFARLSKEIDELNDPQRRDHVLNYLGQQGDALNNMPFSVKTKLLTILSEKQKEFLSLPSGYASISSIYWQLDRAKHEQLRKHWEENDVDYMDVTSDRTSEAIEDFCRKGDYKKVERLLKRGFDPLRRAARRPTGFFTIAMEYPEALKLVLAQGVPADTPLDKNRTALTMQCERHDPKTEIVRLLLDAGADANRRDAKGRAPLHNAILHDKDKIAEMLLEHKADPNALDADKCTPLELAESRPKMHKARLVAVLSKYDAKRATTLPAPTTRAKP
jgi:hypothetical protein